MSEHAILNLNEFKDKKTFIFLYERLLALEKLTQQLKSLLGLPVEVINFLESKNIRWSNLIDLHYNNFYIFYRSMFQKSDWEKNIRKHIDPSSYFGNDLNNLNFHNDICLFVDKVLAHQDYGSGLRTIFGPIEKEGYPYWVVSTYHKHHPQNVQKHIVIMLATVRDVYKNKFGEELNLL